MRAFFAEMGGLIVALILLVGIVVGGTFGYIFLYRTAAPMQAENERTVYENTPSYVQGKTQEIGKLKREYDASKDERDRKALRETILTAASTVDRSKLPADLRGFLRDLEANK